jgi:RNA polymerase primary sigma factor
LKNTHHWIDQNEIKNYLKDIKKYPVLSRDEELEIVKKIKIGCEESKKTLIYSNLKYVITIAKDYQGQGLPLSDLISEGNYGLIKAAERYNYDQTEIKFLSYAVHWIRQSIRLSLNENSRTIRIPGNVIMDINRSKKSKFGEAGYSSEVPFVPTVTSIDKSLNDEGDSFYEILENINASKPDGGEYDNKKLLSELNSILNKLEKQERFVIVKNLGLDGDDMTLQDIANILCLTKERVRQIKERAIKKLRHNSKSLFELL